MFYTGNLLSTSDRQLTKQPRVRKRTFSVQTTAASQTKPLSNLLFVVVVIGSGIFFVTGSAAGHRVVGWLLIALEHCPASRVDTADNAVPFGGVKTIVVITATVCATLDPAISPCKYTKYQIYLNHSLADVQNGETGQLIRF